jgi:hypothetical protein
MSESLNVSGPVEIESTSKEMVAFKLLERITHNENAQQHTKDRKYWLTLYVQCLKATDGLSLDRVLKQE